MTDVPVDANDLLFEARTPLGFSVRVTVARWNLIVTAKHPVMAGRESLARAALETPDEVRQSRSTFKCYSSTKRRRRSAGRARS